MFPRYRTLLAGALLASLAAPTTLTAGQPHPVLATAAQRAAEQRVLRILRHPAVRAAAARQRALLLADPAAQVPEGRALLDHALDLWVNSLAFAVASADPSRPTILWAGEDTPRTWFGHTLPGGGVAGDNPDNIYLGGYLDGASSYEITGRVPANGPANLTLEIFKGRPGRLETAPPPPAGGKPRADLGNQVRMFQRADLGLDAGGRFTVTLGPDAADRRPNHVQTPPVPIQFTFRNTLTDWRQAPVIASIRRTDAAPSGPQPDDDEIATRVADYLPDWVGAWTRFKEHYLGAPPVNKLAGAVPRDGNWGWLAGGAFDVKPDEALVVTTASNGAAYTGFQVLDRWFLSADTRKAFTSLNNAQAVANPDGTTTYIVALADPGVANWLDASASPHGFANLRWQGMPPGASGEGLLRDVKLVKLADLPSVLPATLPRVTPAERAVALHRRAADYEHRLVVAAR